MRHEPKPQPRIDLDLEVKRFKPGWAGTQFTDGTHTVWIGKNLYVLRDKNDRPVRVPMPGTTYKVNVPAWLAEKEGLI